MKSPTCGNATAQDWMQLKLWASDTPGVHSEREDRVDMAFGGHRSTRTGQFGMEKRLLSCQQTGRNRL
jgi:hypothetical protein